MTTPTIAAPADLLAQVAAERQTGALVVGGHPGGAVYVFEGRVIYAESPAAPGVGELLTSSGRLAARTWQTALELGTPGAQVGRLLLDQGHLTQGELELCALGATYDAAYFALTTPSAPVEFHDGATHWLGPVARIDPASIGKEVRRRTRLLDEIYPDPRVDVSAVAPVRRPPLQRMAITALQWELLVAADGRRTPADLAQVLGRSGFAVVQEVRRLAAAGLVKVPDVRTSAPPAPRTVPPAPVRPQTQDVRGQTPDVRPQTQDVRRPAPTPDGRRNGSATDVRPGISGSENQARVPDVRRPSDPPAVVTPSPPVEGPSPRHSLPDDANANQGAYRPPRLARRKPGAKLPKDLAAEPPPVHQGTDEVLLKRIRTALRALR